MPHAGKVSKRKATTTTKATAAVKLFNCHPQPSPDQPIAGQGRHTAQCASIMPYINTRTHTYMHDIYTCVCVCLSSCVSVCVCVGKGEVALILACIKCAPGGCFRSRSAIFIICVCVCVCALLPLLLLLLLLLLQVFPHISLHFHSGFKPESRVQSERFKPVRATQFSVAYFRAGVSFPLFGCVSAFLQLPRTANLQFDSVWVPLPPPTTLSPSPSPRSPSPF